MCLSEVLVLEQCHWGRFGGRNGQLDLVGDHLGDRGGAVGELIHVADLDRPGDAVTLIASRLEGAGEPPVVFSLGAVEDAAHVIRVLLAQIERVGNGELRIENFAAGQGEENAVALLHVPRSLC